jgi:hypothetical protein
MSKAIRRKRIKTVKPNELAFGKTTAVVIDGWGFDTNYSKNRVVLKLKKTKAPSEHVSVSETIPDGHTSKNLQVNVSSNELLRQELAQIPKAADRAFLPTVELLDDAKNKIGTIHGAAKLMFTDEIKSITPSNLERGKSNRVKFVGIGFDKDHRKNNVVLKKEGSDVPYEHIEKIPKPDQPGEDEDPDTSTTFYVRIKPTELAQKDLELIPSVEVEDSNGVRYRTVPAAAGLKVKITVP